MNRISLYKMATNALLSFSSLATGAVIYIITRPESYIGKLATNSTFLQHLRSICFSHSFYVIGCYLSDYLWALSFCCVLNLIFFSKKEHIYSPILVIFVGILWETAQYFRIISGTSDFWDILMYIAAGCTSVIINNLLKGERT